MGFLKTPNDSDFVPENNQVPIPVLESSSDSGEEEEVVQPIGLPQYQIRRQGQSKHRRRGQQIQDGSSCRNCKVGRRWSRRIDNCVFLLNLMKVGEDEVDDIGVQEPSVFQRLLCDNQAMEVWDSFISQPEEQQLALLSHQIAWQQAKQRETSKPFKSNKYFNRICPIVREFLFSEYFPKDTLLILEPSLIEFFQSSPCGQYVSNPLANNDRKVLHGLAQYLDLRSKSFNTHASCDYRYTKITNPNNTFTAPEMLLSQFLGLS